MPESNHRATPELRASLAADLANAEEALAKNPSDPQVQWHVRWLAMMVEEADRLLKTN